MVEKKQRKKQRQCSLSLASNLEDQSRQDSEIGRSRANALIFDTKFILFFTQFSFSDDCMLTKKSLPMLIIIFNEARLPFQAFVVPRRALVWRASALPEGLFFSFGIFGIGLISFASLWRMSVRRGRFLVIEYFFVDDFAVVAGGRRVESRWSVVVVSMDWASGKAVSQVSHIFLIIMFVLSESLTLLL